MDRKNLNFERENLFCNLFSVQICKSFQESTGIKLSEDDRVDLYEKLLDWESNLVGGDNDKPSLL